MSGEFAGRVALVTGAGGGLGLCHAEFLAARGAKVVVNDFGGGFLGLPDQGVESERAEGAAERIRRAGGEAVANHGSVADPEAAEAMVRQAVDAFGRIDIVVNNAGFASAQFFPDVDDAEMQRHFEVTLLGCLHTMRAAWPHMVEAKYGRIVNTGSAAAFGNPIASYASTKAGLFGLTRTAALFGRAHGIHVNLLLPAAYSRLTALLPENDFKTKLRDEFTPEKTSPLVAWLCHERSAVTAEAFSAGGGRIARIVYAASPAPEIDTSLESVEKAVAETLAATDLEVLASTHDDMVNLGFPPE